MLRAQCDTLHEALKLRGARGAAGRAGLCTPLPGCKKALRVLSPRLRGAGEGG